jgi:hypothetical protein
MTAIYTRCPKEVRDMVLTLVAEHHPLIEEAGVTFDLLFYEDDHGKGLKHHGYLAAAIVRNVPVKDRAKGCADIEIVIDAEGWELWSDAQRRAILDHEITHVELVLKRGQVQSDAAKRPKTRLRLHDWQIGGFADVARRHRAASVEVYQAKQLMDDHGNYLFDWKRKERKP